MEFNDIKQHIASVPYILPELADDLYHFIRAQRPERCLELGFAHGASSCYMAAALHETGAGHLDCVDLLEGLNWHKEPRIEELLAKTGLADYVSVHREHTSYTWFLKKQIEARTADGRCEPLYDFCFIDGAKHLNVDGAAFFLVDKLLKPGGWILFDDLQWTYASKRAEGKRKTDGISMLTMGEDELNQPHIELVFELLVMQHPDYSDFTIKNDWWAWAHKAPGSKSVNFIYSEEFTRKRAAQQAAGRRFRKPFTHPTT